jgi:hypothetical protein
MFGNASKLGSLHRDVDHHQQPVFVKQMWSAFVGRVTALAAIAV